MQACKFVMMSLTSKCVDDYTVSIPDHSGGFTDCSGFSRTSRPADATIPGLSYFSAVAAKRRPKEGHKSRKARCLAVARLGCKNELDHSNERSKNGR